jgi:hypothetical protein
MFQRRFIPRSVSTVNCCQQVAGADPLHTVGNEEEHIIISVVRTDKVGFLKNIRRTNVMLSRCKRSMVICTNRAFLHGIAASSLMGTLATVLGEQAWLKWP